ncbi:hypothetical protein K1719_003846 [Acacia pycnantha]|nr:hypothetical protein K1719_003846 [Acacia pycnantha]
MTTAYGQSETEHSDLILPWKGEEEQLAGEEERASENFHHCCPQQLRFTVFLLRSRLLPGLALRPHYISHAFYM